MQGQQWRCRKGASLAMSNEPLPRCDRQDAAQADAGRQRNWLAGRNNQPATFPSEHRGAYSASLTICEHARLNWSASTPRVYVCVRSEGEANKIRPPQDRNASELVGINEKTGGSWWQTLPPEIRSLIKSRNSMIP